MPSINVQDDIAKLKAKIRLYPLIGVAVGVVIGFLLKAIL